MRLEIFSLFSWDVIPLQFNVENLIDAAMMKYYVGGSISTKRNNIYLRMEVSTTLEISDWADLRPPFFGAFPLAETVPGIFDLVASAFFA